jgi:hypothetical protein
MPRIVFRDEKRFGRCNVKEERPEVAEVVRLLSYALELLSPIPEAGKKLAAHRRYLRLLSERGGGDLMSVLASIRRNLILQVESPS